ncbi:MAG: hypothetical protein KDA24_15290 [Deltaproteobacteria bacterium]|nr:hypothetical protein [Deltaproteobacteria bacterium]
MNHANPEGALRIAAQGEAPPGFWDRLPELVRPPAPPLSDRPPSAFLLALRQRIAHRRAPETLTLFRTIARLAGERVEDTCATCFDGLFRADERGAIVQGLFADLFDGGLATFAGVDGADLLGFVTLRADRAVLHASVSRWAIFEVRSAHRARYRDLLSDDEVDEIGADVLSELLSRSLARFEGGNDRQLYVYVRTTAHRAVSRAARRKVLDRESVARLREEAPPDLPPLVGRPAPAPRVRLRPRDPLPISADDEAYLRELLEAGGKLASVAASRGVSRGSVTKMVQRILGRLDALSVDERERVGEWAEATLGELRPPG